MKCFTTEILASLAKQVKTYEGRRCLLRQQFYSRRCRMNTKLEGIEIKRAANGDHDLAIQHIAVRELLKQWIDELGKVEIEGFLVAALDQDLVSIAKNQRAKSIPFRLKAP